LKSLYKIKKVANATHNMYAYRISRGNGNFNSDCDDDGETHAGSRLLHLLEVKIQFDLIHSTITPIFFRFLMQKMS